jgi:hypothetical protein
MNYADASCGDGGLKKNVWRISLLGDYDRALYRTYEYSTRQRDYTYYESEKTGTFFC